ncbi:MAG: glycosyltransferase family 4 protein [Planctomycetota bacterium]
MKMRVAVLTTASTFSGAERHSLQLTEYLINRGHDAFLACVGDSTYRVYQEAARESVPLILIKEELARNSGRFFQWMAIFRELNADVCIFEKPTLLHGSVRFDFAARLSHKRYITIQQVAPFHLPNLWTPWIGRIGRIKHWVLNARLRGYLRSIYPHCTIAVSDSVRQNLISLYGFPRKRTIAIRNGVDSGQFQPNRTMRENGRKEYRVPANALVFGTACRLSPEKGLDFGVACFHQLVRKFPESQLVWLIAGAGSIETEIRNQITRLELENHIHLLGFTKKIQQFYASCDFYLLPSRREGLPLSLLEAMSTGCCPIATAIDGIPEIITSKSVGWLVPQDDTARMVEAMEEAVSMTNQEREHLSHRARKHIQKVFELEDLLRQIASLVEMAN